MGLATEMADAVAAELAAAPAGTFTPAITPVRSVLPEFELRDLAELRVTVVPRAIEITSSTRAAGQYDVMIDVGVQQKLGADLDAEVAALGTLVDQIAAYLARRRLAAAPKAHWAGIENDPVYAVEHLKQQRVFTSVVTVTYRLWK